VGKQSAEESQSSEEKPSTEDTEMKDAEVEKKEDAVAPAEESVDGSATPADKSKGRRKSVGVPEHKGKKLNRKQSKAKITHVDAKPGDYFYVKMSGHPSWPAIIADEDMLPQALLSSRPVTALRPDGSWREDLADGGKNVASRKFPVMYMGTNEL
jgi:hypothetical protein